ncbi:MAG: hypothetical protein IJC98_01750 [Clostridia bacterium]|nr:hypothetical protein [Clostridia bacterium]
MGNKIISKKWFGFLFLFIVCVSVFVLSASARIPENEENGPVLGYGTPITDRRGGTANDVVNAAGDVVTDAAGFVGDVVTDAGNAVGKAANDIGNAVGDVVTDAADAIGDAFDGSKTREQSEADKRMGNEAARSNQTPTEGARDNVGSADATDNTTRGNGISWLLFLILIIAAGAIIALILLPRRKHMM